MHSINQVDLEAKRRAELIAQANLSPRYRELDTLDKYVDGSQYDGRPHWFSDAVPLYERRPCIVYPIAERAIRSHVDLVLGEGRWPRVTTHPGEDDTVFDDDMALSDDESEIVDRFIAGIVDQACLRTVCDSALTAGLSAKTAVLVCCIRYGKLAVDVIPAKWCTPTFTAEGCVASLEIRYPYVEDFFDDDKQRWSSRCMLYRRVIDAAADTTYHPAPAAENGMEPDSWAVDSAQTIVHDLGFCPAIWYAHMRRCEKAGTYDGVAIHEKLLDEINGLNFALSQEHRAALQTGNPTIIETGVEDGEPNAPRGRDTAWASIIGPNGKPISDPDSMHSWNRGSSARAGLGGRKTGPGSIWTFTSPNSKVGYLTLPAGALDALAKNGDRLLAMLRESMAYVESDPEHAKLGGGDLSGKALEWLHRKQIDRCNKEREDFGENCLVPLLGMLLRVALVKGREGKKSGLYLAGLDKAAPILAKFERQVAANDGAPSEEKRWFCPEVTLMWGPYFALTEADAKLAQERTIAAYKEGLITRRVAVETLAPFYPTIKDVEQFLDALEEEAREKMSAMHDAQAALTGAAEEVEPPEAEEPEEQPVMQAKPPANAMQKPAMKPAEANPRQPPPRMRPRMQQNRQAA